MADFVAPNTERPRWLLPTLGALLAGAAGLALGYGVGVRPVRPVEHVPGFHYLGMLPVIPLVAPCISIEDAARITAQLTQLRGSPRVMVLIHTLGGSLPPVVQIARAIQRHGNVDVFVPFHALSGGTLVGLAAKRLLMWPHATLGPVDPQIGHFSASSLRAIVKAKPVESIDDVTLGLAHEAEKALEQVTALTREFVGDRPETVRRLVAGRTPHSYPITYEEAKLIGVQVVQARVYEEIKALIEAVIPIEDFEPWHTKTTR